jgi:N-acetyl-anhydromuramyl-L-alanine amidase AmpD
LCNTASSASCHYVVSKLGEITQLVPITYASWCQGITTSATKSSTSSIVKSRGVNPNLYAVGIEHEGFYSDCKGCLTDAQKQASGKLIKHIADEIKSTFGTTLSIDRDPVIGHYQVNPSGKPNCPGENFPWSDVINIANTA